MAVVVIGVIVVAAFIFFEILDQKGGYTNLTAMEAKELIDTKPDLVILDVSNRYDQGHWVSVEDDAGVVGWYCTMVYVSVDVDVESTFPYCKQDMFFCLLVCNCTHEYILFVCVVHWYPHWLYWLFVGCSSLIGYIHT